MSVVIILGSVIQDVICQVAALPRPGETVIARHTAFLPGGKGANQAIAAARMGAVTHMIGAVGEDAAGAAMLAYLSAAGVDTAGVRRLPGEPTGAAFIAVSADGENQIVVAPGANALVSAHDVTPETVGSARVRLAQQEVPVGAVEAFFAASAAGLRILNTAPAVPEGERLFEAADLLILNQPELARYLRLAEEPPTPD